MDSFTYTRQRHPERSALTRRRTFVDISYSWNFRQRLYSRHCRRPLLHPGPRSGRRSSQVPPQLEMVALTIVSVNDPQSATTLTLFQQRCPSNASHYCSVHPSASAQYDLDRSCSYICVSRKPIHVPSADTLHVSYYKLKALEIKSSTSIKADVE